VDARHFDVKQVCFEVEDSSICCCAVVHSMRSGL
jgi:hypothetical protein